MAVFPSLLSQYACLPPLERLSPESPNAEPNLYWPLGLATLLFPISLPFHSRQARRILSFSLYILSSWDIPVALVFKAQLHHFPPPQAPAALLGLCLFSPNCASLLCLVSPYCVGLLRLEASRG